MAQLLYIIAHPNITTSHTARLGLAFLEGYRETHPEDSVVTLDLCASDIPYLTPVHLRAVGKQAAPETMTPEEQAAWAETFGLIQQFTAADKYLVATPLWNFSVPAILKAYIDQIVQAGHTFRYTEIGASIGLLEGRSMAVVSTRGGIYSQPPMLEFEMCVRYLRNVFGFIGIAMTDEIIAEGLALVGPQGQESIMAPALQRAREAGRKF